jgi:prepilin-type N-terminal cleavage/methylation domain-containing protein
MSFLRVRLALQDGYTLIEMLTVVVILGTVMSGLMVLFVQGTSAEMDMNARFQAQSDARLALDRLRRDLHCASGATSSSATSVTVNDACVPGGVLTWCASTLSGRTQLFRVVGAACSTSAPRYADYLVSGKTYFAYQAQSTTGLALLYVCIPVNTKPKRTVDTYALQDRIVFRNSSRTGAAATVAQPACPG